MKYFVCLFLCLTTTLLFSQSNPLPPANRTASVVPQIAAQADPKAKTLILDSYGKLPLSFEANYGQTDSQVKFLSRTGAYSLFLTENEAVFVLSPKTNVKTKTTTGNHPMPAKAASVLRMKLRNANPAAKVVGADERLGKSNYFIGNDPKKWRTGVPTYAKVKYEGIYSGIDLVYYGNQRQLEYDFIVAPGADPHRIAFDIRGAKGIRRNAHGDLALKAGESEIRWHTPVAYQEKNGERHLVAVRYAITDTNRVGFELAKYDPSLPLYIDPLIYSSYLGGSSADYGQGIAVDNSGNAYLIGYTSSTNFPIMNAWQPAYDGNQDAFVTKLNPNGSSFVYSTYLGGSGTDYGYGVAVDNMGNAYVTGYTFSTDFPVTPGVFQPACGGGCESGPDVFVTKINPSGSALVYSTYLGGSGADNGFGIAVDNAGNAYVTGATGSTDFPVTPGAFQTAYAGGKGDDAFVTKINPTASALVYSSYLGGNRYDSGSGIAVDGSGSAYVIGKTGSTNFPVTPGAFQTICNDGNECANYDDAFVSKFSSTGSALVYSTYLGGGRSDVGTGIAVDGLGNAYVTGLTHSTDFPITPSAFQTVCNGCGGNPDAYVSKLNPTGSALVYSTYLGGSGQDAGSAIALDGAGNVIVTGTTTSANFPTLNKLQGYSGPHEQDAFVSKLNPSGSALIYSTYLGGGAAGAVFANGIAADSDGNVYVTGMTGPDFPTMNPLQPAYGGGSFDAFVAKLFILPGTTTILTSSPNPSTYGEAVTFTATVTSGVGSPPDGETVPFMKGKAVIGTGILSGGSASFTTSTLKVGTNSITAVYGGDSNFAGSTSKPVKQVVEKAGDASLVQR